MDHFLEPNTDRLEDHSMNRYATPIAIARKFDARRRCTLAMNISAR